ncbi:MAG: AMP-binding protein [Bacteroidetes bacterium]|nr:AMP-binding protein [Bacteroidota bacterium]
MKFCFDSKKFVDHQTQPEKLAVIDDRRELSWMQFMKEADLICAYFKKHGWNKQTKPIIIYGHKQAEMITAIYAMMQLEIAYIPIDHLYPKERIATILRLAGTEIVINCSAIPLKLEGTTELQINNENLQIIQQATVTTKDKNEMPDPLVYIIFTSGSTGEPKGVQISTEAVRSFTKWMTGDFGFSHDDVFINTAVFSFDLSVFELMTFGALGATLLMNDTKTTTNTENLINRIEKYQGNIWVATPSFALAYTRIGADPGLDCVKYFLFCGEVLPHSLATNLNKIFPKARIYNTYGPTEATVATTLIEISKEVLDKYNPLPVGYMKPGTKIIIDKVNHEDKEGEMIITGDNVSIGYLNNEELSKEKFFVHNGQRAYRTGDLGYYEGELLFCMGRNDDQIKLKGFRIELNEITNIIRKHELVDNAVTVGLKRNTEVKKIVTFVIPRIKGDIDEIKESIISHSKKYLPFYMVPGDIFFVDDFHYNMNYKIDTKKLIELYLNHNLY